MDLSVSTTTQPYVPEPLPALALTDWEQSKTTLHLFAQIVGKIRMALMPARNHWWHVPLYLHARGLTTRPVPYDQSRVEILFDFIDHSCIVALNDGRRIAFALRDRSVAQFYQELFSALAAFGIEPHIRARPYDIAIQTPFARDHTHAHYDSEYVQRFWRILSWMEPVFWEFNGDFGGKLSPIHLFWHSLDLAVTRFSGRDATPPPNANNVNRIAYSREVISFGFWAGDARIPEPAFYAYAYPEPPRLREMPLAPQQAYWGELNGGSLALFRYADMRANDDPRAALLEFFGSAYRICAQAAHWPVDALRA